MGKLRLEALSKEVFPISEEYALIIKFLAINGPSHLNTIIKFVQKKFPNRGWEFIQNRITGTKKINGLLLTDYVFEVKIKGRYGKPEYTYHLLPKGIMAAIQFVPLKQNYFFNKLIKFIEISIKSKKHSKFITQYLASQIKLFLAYHNIQGIQLMWQTDTSLYFSNFIRNLSSGIDISSKQEKVIQEFKSIVEEFVILHSCYTYLTKDPSEIGNYFPSIFHERLSKSKSHTNLWNSYILRWMVGFDQTILEENEDKIMKITRLNEYNFSTDDINWLKYKKKIEKRLKNF